MSPRSSLVLAVVTALAGAPPGAHAALSAIGYEPAPSGSSCVSVAHAHSNGVVTDLIVYGFHDGPPLQELLSIEWADDAVPNAATTTMTVRPVVNTYENMYIAQLHAAAVRFRLHLGTGVGFSCGNDDDGAWFRVAPGAPLTGGRALFGARVREQLVRSGFVTLKQCRLQLRAVSEEYSYWYPYIQLASGTTFDGTNPAYATYATFWPADATHHDVWSWDFDVVTGYVASSSSCPAVDFRIGGDHFGYVNDNSPTHFYQATRSGIGIHYWEVY